MIFLFEIQMWLQVQYINWLPYSGQTLTSLRSQRPLIFWNWQIKDASSIHIMEVYSQIAHVSFKAKARFRSRNKHIIQKKPQRAEFTGTVIIESWFYVCVDGDGCFMCVSSHTLLILFYRTCHPLSEGMINVFPDTIRNTLCHSF